MAPSTWAEAAAGGKLLEAETPAIPDRRVRKRKRNATGISALVDGTLKSQHIVDASSRQYATSITRALAGINIPGPDFSGLLNTGQFAGVGLFDEWEYETIPGKPGKPAVYAADKPPEKFLAHLRWVASQVRCNSADVGSLWWAG